MPRKPRKPRLGRASLIGGLILLGLWPASPALGQGVDTLVVSLAEAERRALAHNPLLAGAEAEIELFEAQRSRARNARFLPEVSLRNIWGPMPKARGEINEYGFPVSPDSLVSLDNLSWFTQVDLQLVQPLFTFGKISSRVEAAEFGIEASQAGLEKTQGQILTMVRQLYWGVVLANELDRVVGEVMDRLAEAEEALLLQYEEGDATQNDLNKFRLFEFEAHRQARDVEDKAEAAREGLRASMGLERGVPIRVEATSLEPLELSLDSLEAYLDLAMANRPELNQLRAGVAARESLKKAEERDSWPTLFLAGGISANASPGRFRPRNPFLKNDWNYFRGGAVLGVDWNLNFLGHKDEIRIQSIETERLRGQLDPLVALVEQEVRESYLKARRAQIDVEEGRAALQISENWFRAEMQTYDIGIGEIKDVIEAFQANVQMETLQLQNIATFNIAVAELSQRVGVDVTGG